MARRTLTRLAILLLAPVVVRADDPVRVRFGWSAPTDCRREASVTLDVVAGGSVVRGRLRHVGPDPIREVTVCLGRACAKVAGGGVIGTGDVASFEIRDAPPARTKPKLSCSILEVRAGA